VVATVVVPALIVEEEAAPVALRRKSRPPSKLRRRRKAKAPKRQLPPRAGDKAPAAKAAEKPQPRTRARRREEVGVAIRLVVGLGNPARSHEHTRQQRRLLAGRGVWPRRRQSTCARTRNSRRWWAATSPPARGWLLPQSFMNASGRPVQMLAGFFKIKPEEILVVHDELDFEPAVARLKQGGGIAGHNGLKDISQRLADARLLAAAPSAWASRPPGERGPTTMLRSRRPRKRAPSTPPSTVARRAAADARG